MIGKEAAVTHIRLNREMLLIFGFSIFVCVRSDYEVILFLSWSILVTEWLCLASMVCEQKNTGPSCECQVSSWWSKACLFLNHIWKGAVGGLNLDLDVSTTGSRQMIFELQTEKKLPWDSKYVPRITHKYYCMKVKFAFIILVGTACLGAEKVFSLVLHK